MDLRKKIRIIADPAGTEAKIAVHRSTPPMHKYFTTR